MHIIRVSDFPLFCSNNARKRLILLAEWSPQKSLILLEINRQNLSKYGSMAAYVRDVIAAMLMYLKGA